MSDQDFVRSLSLEAELEDTKRLLASTRKSMDIQVEAGIRMALKIAELTARIKELEEPYVYVDRN